MTSPASKPSLHEVALGCFLHDIGKLLQRAGGSQANLPLEVRARASDILPAWQGRHTHIHALWTDLFFDRHPTVFPAGINAANVRRVAVYHHKPDSPWSELCTMADHIASGMDRKAKDEETDPTLQEPKGWDAFIKTPLHSCYSSVRLPVGQISDPPSSAADMIVPLAALDPSTPLFPFKRSPAESEKLPAQYKRLGDQLAAQLNRLAEAKSELGIPVFCETMISLSERFLSAVPSSTRDQPDISLHDHARATAAVGAALYAFHEKRGTLEDRAAIRQGGEKKFVWVAGDLSGIQSSLFRLASQQVRGVNKILRARSFLIAMLLEAALLECRRALGLTVFSTLQNAGGRFLLLAPDNPGVADAIAGVRRAFEPWLWNRYTGEVALNLAVSDAFAPHDLKLDRFRATLALAEQALGLSKLKAFSEVPDPVHRQDYSLHGACRACEIRPGTELRQEDDFRCATCDDEERLGSDLPKSAAIAWTRNTHPAHGKFIAYPAGLRLGWMPEPPASTRDMESFFQIYEKGET